MEYQIINEVDSVLTPVQQILMNRGINLSDIEHYLHTTDDDILPTAAIDNIDEGVKMLVRHLHDDKRILVIVDSDADGYTSSAFLINYLYKFYPTAVENKVYYKFHEGKEHGIKLHMVEPDTGLVIVPDAGSNDYEQHKELRDQGIDVLVIDHHMADRVSEDACIINNQLCNYPNKTLSGVGMVYKFFKRFDEMSGNDYADEQLDIVALGMIADMMDIRNFETRQLIKKGLDNINNTFLVDITEQNSYSLGEVITPIGITFYVAPYVNAVTRLGTQEEKETLFRSLLTQDAMTKVPSTKRGHKGEEEYIVTQAVRMCTNIKARQNKASDSYAEKLDELIAKDNLLDRKILIIKIEDSNLNRNLTGLIANQLAAKYQRPTMLLNRSLGSWAGSARNPANSKLHDFRSFVNNSKLARYAQGHASAFGVSFSDQGLDNFIKYSEEKLHNIMFEPIFRVDFIWHGNTFKSDDVLKIAELESYWGQNISEALVVIEDVKVHKDNAVLMSKDKNPTIKITLPNGVSCIKFKSSEEEYEKLVTSPIGSCTVTLIGKCKTNFFRGERNPQIMIQQYEITGRQDYCF